MMKRIVWSIIGVFVLPLTMGWSEEVYCRYELGGQTSYGRVYGEKIQPLNHAPWNGGIETGQKVDLNQVQLLHPSEPQKIIGLSGSYKEAWPEGKVPFKTIRWFLKPPSSAANPKDDVILPSSVDILQVETELVIVIGKKIKDGTPEEAKDAIFGYTAANDIVGEVTSYHQVQGEPLNQVEPLLPTCLKMGDGFAPFGPFIHRGVDWRDHKRTLKITNSKTGKNLYYEHNTPNMVYTPEKIVSDISRVFTLDPGDIILTGTTQALPAEEGDIMEVTVEGLGTVINQVKKSKS